MEKCNVVDDLLTLKVMIVYSYILDYQRVPVKHIDFPCCKL